MRQSRITVLFCLAALLLTGQAFAVDQAKRAEIAKAKAEVLEQHASAEGSGERPAPSELLTQPGVQAVDPAGKAPLDDAITCLSRSIYWEAKGQEKAEMEAVASVVMNRLGHAEFPGTVCEVATQGSEQGRCQFSWWCDGRPDQVQEEASYEIAKEIARKALNQQLADRTGGALYFHGKHASPRWATTFIKTLETDQHVFYKPRTANPK